MQAKAILQSAPYSVHFHHVSVACHAAHVHMINVPDLYNAIVDTAYGIKLSKEAISAARIPNNLGRRRSWAGKVPATSISAFMPLKASKRKDAMDSPVTVALFCWRLLPHPSYSAETPTEADEREPGCWEFPISQGMFSRRLPMATWSSIA